MNLNIRRTSEYKALSVEETLNTLQTSLEGLKEAEASERLKSFGYNEITEKKQNPFIGFISRYWGPMPWLLELAMVLSFLLDRPLEGIIILILLTINATIGYIHSRNSQRAVELLKSKLAVKAKVIREGKTALINARELVPGDIILIKLGDIIPADAKIIGDAIAVDESALTGESLPKEAHTSDIVFSGSTVKRGETRCVVVNTGANTYFGRTTELVKIAKPKSHQEEVMMTIVRYMMYLGIVASVVVAGYAVIMHVKLILIATFIVTFLMGAVPVALPAVLTIVQAAGAVELSKKNILVTRLDSVEDASSIDILCLDKTGTITQNNLTVTDSVSFNGCKKEDVIRLAMLASQEKGMDAIDLAIISYGKAHGIDKLVEQYKQISFVPFDPSIKRTEAIVEGHGERFKVVKGAAQMIISLSKSMDKETMDKIEATVKEFSLKGYRTLAVGRTLSNDSDKLKFVGLIALSDPPRKCAAKMIEEIKSLGIKPMMLTGDHVAIAREIARQVGIGDKVIKLPDIKDLKEEEQIKIVEQSDGFAQIYPEDKYRIVKLLQSGGHAVGMTGDGVNDAPALKQAEMGIAVSNSTDVAKASASVVLTEDGINVIVDAIKVSRETFQRMLSWVINKETKVIAFVGVLTIGFFWLHRLVLSLLGMSLLVFANDFITMSLATDNVKHTSNPNNWNVKDITLASLVLGILLILETIFVMIIGKRYFHITDAEMQTLVLLNMVFASQFRILIVRERQHFWSSMPGRELLISTVATLILFVILGSVGWLMPAITFYKVILVLILSAVFTLLLDFPKYYVFKKFGL
ncbi:MAG: plasma-membrane proton-efflux P-type ATPase [bacterium]